MAEYESTIATEHQLLNDAKVELGFAFKEWQTEVGKMGNAAVAAACVALATELRIRRCM